MHPGSRLSQERVTKRPKLTCRNWECGVLVQTDPGDAETGPISSPIVGIEVDEENG